MRLTLILDGDIGTPVAEENIEDHPDKATLQEALDAINEQAQKTLVEEPEAAQKQAAADAKAAEAQTKAAEKSGS